MFETTLEPALLLSSVGQKSLLERILVANPQDIIPSRIQFPRFLRGQIPQIAFPKMSYYYSPIRSSVQLHAGLSALRPARPPARPSVRPSTQASSPVVSPSTSTRWPETLLACRQADPPVHQPARMFVGPPPAGQPPTRLLAHFLASLSVRLRAQWIHQSIRLSARSTAHLLPPVQPISRFLVRSPARYPVAR